MALSVARIRALVEDESVDLPPISCEQARVTRLILEVGQRDRLAREKREQDQRQ
ncbi:MULTISPECIES: hypothetical protein [unclassified Nocardioides]|uniref:hypothetical protein n=1 Tax=unclassified Nocardioides TaxID=2615069 RepID=UPI000A7D61A4|nr:MULTISPECIES: hypothetical protein [unclassified Nocardioides]